MTTSMKTMSALQAKNAFGQFLEASQRGPVAVTKNRRLVAAMFSIEDVRNMARAYLSEPLQAQVESGEMSAMTALLRQARVNERIRRSREEAARGEVRTMDERYFDDLRTHVLNLSNTNAK